MKHEFAFFRGIDNYISFFECKNCGSILIHDHAPSDKESEEFVILKCDEEIVKLVLKE